MKEPIFKLNEIVVENPYTRGTGVDMGEPKLFEATVLYVGMETLKYKVGDLILLDFVRRKEIDYFEKKLLAFPEPYVLCGIEN